MKFLFNLSLVAVFLILLFSPVLPLPLNSTDSLLKTLQIKKATTIIVSIRGSNVASLRAQVQNQKHTFSTRVQKITYLYNLLKDYADTTQAPILRVLNKIKSKRPIVVHQLWISNQIIVKNANYFLVKKLLKMKEVAEVREEKVFPLPEVIVNMNPVADEPWGVVAIHAKEAWALGNRGEGTVIGTTDTGVRWTHEALRDGFRQDFGWFDPYDLTPYPNDQGGHGTHTTGTIVGRTKDIGVAPGAQWISCKGCLDGLCGEGELLLCGQWHLCPTNAKGGNPNCSKAPNAVSNSWGGGNGYNFYDDVIEAWKVADIAPVFSIGNNGADGCGSANSPGDSEGAFAVGASTITNGHASYSSKGPTVKGGRIKPEVSAPGSSILSSYHLADNRYAALSGSSMACPHVAGLAALLYSEDGSLTYEQVRSALIKGAVPMTPSGGNCGDISETRYPNNHAGYGRIDAVRSLKSIKSL